MEAAIVADTRRRLACAHARIDRAEPPALAEFDLMRGLTGLGAYLLRCHPDRDVTSAVLSYLVRLTLPLPPDDQGRHRPGWWVRTGPHGRLDPNRFPDGHANLGLAHGIAGPLALLALAWRQGVTVDGHREAIDRICAWVDTWQPSPGAGTGWPYWVTRAEPQGKPTAAAIPRRPSWCYGAAGVGRARQLAAIAVGDAPAAAIASAIVADALTAPALSSTVTDTSLCHGWSGLAYLATTVAADSPPPITARLRMCLPTLREAACPTALDPAPTAAAMVRSPGGPGLLDGAAGVALALVATHIRPRCGWNTCLLTG